MFPNPQDAVPLPAKPSLEQYRKRAKGLVRACNTRDRDAVLDWARVWIEALVASLGAPSASIPPDSLDRAVENVGEFAWRTMSGEGLKESGSRDRTPCALADAQLVIARSHGFPSWPKMVRHLEALSRAGSPIAGYEAAADAIVTGDVGALQRLLHETPALIHARSSREHDATLLHYVSANGVEGYRQKTPSNAVEIATMLLDGGADVDAEANVYGGGCTTLGLVATSAHPRKAGNQIALIELLLERGARLEHPTAGGNGQGAVMSALANGCPEAATYLADRGAPVGLVEAAALGRLDEVERDFDGDGNLKPIATRASQDTAFRYACGYGRTAVVEFLLTRGAGLAEHGGDGQTGLHYAAIFGHLETIELLVANKAPLEARNMYGGTVLGQAAWSAAHGGDPEVYAAIIETLIEAGALVPARHPPINARIDALLLRHGSRPDDSLSWYGEKPKKRKA